MPRPARRSRRRSRRSPRRYRAAPSERTLTAINELLRQDVCEQEREQSRAARQAQARLARSKARLDPDRLINVPGDGDCFYHAVRQAILLKYNRSIAPDGAALRRMLGEHLKNHPEEGPLEDAVRQRVEENEWAEHDEVWKMIDMIREKYKISLCISVYNTTHGWQHFPGASTQCDWKISLYNDNVHFQILMDAQTARGTSAP